MFFTTHSRFHGILNLHDNPPPYRNLYHDSATPLHPVSYTYKPKMLNAATAASVAAITQQETLKIFPCMYIISVCHCLVTKGMSLDSFFSDEDI